MYPKLHSLPFVIGLLFIGILLLGGCTSSPLDDDIPPNISDYTITHPNKIAEGQLFPIVIKAIYQDPRMAIWETLHISSENASMVPDIITLKRGAGSVSTLITGVGQSTIEIRNNYGNLIGTIDILIEDNLVYRELSGVLLENNLIWDSTAVIHIVGDVTVPAGSDLYIRAGTRVEIDEYVRLIAEGNIFSEGKADAPVFITAYDRDQPWGEIYHTASGYYRYTFLTQGGGDESRSWGHSHSQPVLTGTDCMVVLENSYIIDNPGKAAGMEYSRFSAVSSLISRCDTGGELRYCHVTLEDCYYIDMPNGDGIEVDDDNDALYLNHQLEGADDSVIKQCVFVTGKDDCIDNNGARVRIEDCVIEDFYHEGLAASSPSHSVVYNTLVVGCEQGIEAGYGSPQVTVNHCTVVGNDIGFRLGDSYDEGWGCHGTLTAINSISVTNTINNVWNYDLTISGPREGAVTITYSIVNNPEYDGGEGCLTGLPEFTEDFLLEDGSVGVLAASDGSDMGILP
jgi:hypothetical protein